MDYKPQNSFLFHEIFKVRSLLALCMYTEACTAIYSPLCGLCLSVCVSVVLPCDTESECIVLAVTFSSSFSYFWLLFPVTPLPPLLSPFSPSYRGPWGTAESSERVRLSYIRFCFAKQDINISNQSQLELGDILNNQDICLIIWLVNSINQHCKSL